jgi:hypothetical protein
MVRLVTAIVLIMSSAAAVADDRPPLYLDQTELTYAEAVRCSENPIKIPEARLPLEKLVGPHQRQRCSELEMKTIETEQSGASKPHSVLPPGDK